MLKFEGYKFKNEQNPIFFNKLTAINQDSFTNQTIIKIHDRPYTPKYASSR